MYIIVSSLIHNLYWSSNCQDLRHPHAFAFCNKELWRGTNFDDSSICTAMSRGPCRPEVLQTHEILICIHLYIVKAASVCSVKVKLLAKHMTEANLKPTQRSKLVMLKTFLQEFRCGSICVFPQFVPRFSVGFFFPLWRALHLKDCPDCKLFILRWLPLFLYSLVHRRAALATWITHLCTHRVSHRWSHESHLCDTWFGTLPIFWSPEVFQLLRWGIAMLFWTSRSSQTCWHTASWNCLPREAAEEHRIASKQLQMIDSFEFLSTLFDLQDLPFKSFALLSHPFGFSICAQATAGYVAKIGKWSDSHDCRLAWLTEDAEITLNSNQKICFDARSSFCASFLSTACTVNFIFLCRQDAWHG